MFPEHLLTSVAPHLHTRGAQGPVGALARCREQGRRPPWLWAHMAAAQAGGRAPRSRPLSRSLAGFKASVASRLFFTQPRPRGRHSRLGWPHSRLGWPAAPSSAFSKGNAEQVEQPGLKDGPAAPPSRRRHRLDTEHVPPFSTLRAARLCRVGGTGTPSQTPTRGL